MCARRLNAGSRRAVIERLEAEPDPDAPGQLDIALAYRLRGTQQAGELYFSVDLTGGTP